MTPDNKVNILVVDDLTENLLVMESILVDLGENVIVARSGEEALQKVLQHDFAVILIDVNMPSMDGYETAVLIHKRRRCAHTPIIFITSYADELQTAQGYSLGAVDYILSPVNPAILRTKVRVFVELFQMAAQARRHADERVALAQAQAARLAAEAAHRQSAFLAQTSATLATSLDPETTIRSLARMSVPLLADLCAVTLPHERALVGSSELCWTRAPDAPLATTQLEATALPGPLGDAIKKVLQTGQMEHFEDLAVPAAAAPASWGNPAASGPPFALRSVLILPLPGRAKILGTLSLCLGPSGRNFGPAETLLAEDLASRAAVFLDNARLYRDIQEADTRKNEFLAMLAHELRNPLAAIRGAVHVLCLSDLGKDKIAWARAIIDRQVNQLVRLVDDLLDVARITQGKIRLQLESVDVSAVIDMAKELSSPILAARQHVLSVSSPKGVLYVRGDATRLAQVLANLLSNAAKYTDAGGQIELNAERDHEQVLLRVRDNGIGIPAEMIATIFDLFTQANRSLDRAQGGLGIGLTLVRHIVEMHGGSVSVTSAGHNKGSEFVVQLPLVPPPQVTTAPVWPAPQTVSGGLRVMVVDDNLDVADSLEIMLRQRGHQVCLAYDGPAALSAAQTFHPQVVLLDIGLPGIDGYEVARRMRGMPELKGAFLVAITGYGQPEARRTANQAGFDVHLVKPVDPQALHRLMAGVPLVSKA